MRPDIFPHFLFYGLTYLHIFYVVSAGLVLIISLSFFIRALVGDDIFSLFLFLGLFGYAHSILLDRVSHVLI